MLHAQRVNSVAATGHPVARPGRPTRHAGPGRSSGHVFGRRWRPSRPGVLRAARSGPHRRDRAVGRGPPDWGAMAARLGRALRGYSTPPRNGRCSGTSSMRRRSRELLGSIRDARHRELVRLVLDRFDATVVPRSGRRYGPRSSIRDLTTDNFPHRRRGEGRRDRRFRRHEPQRTHDRPRIAARRVADRPPDDESFRCARLVIDGYERITPLEPIELAHPAGAGRGAGRRDDRDLLVAIRAGPRGPKLAERYNAPVARTIETLLDVGWDEAARRLGAEDTTRPSPSPRCPPRGRPGTRHGGAHLRRAYPRRRGERGLDDGGRRPALSRCVQQRPMRRPWASAGDRGDRPPEPTREHEHALPP